MTIEQIAQILLNNQISFDYDQNFLTVKDSVVISDLFRSASYKVTTRELVLTDDNYNEVNIDTFLNYFDIKVSNNE